MRIVSTCHRDSAFFVGNTVIRFVSDWRVSGFLIHVRRKTAALDHETLDDPVEHDAVAEMEIDEARHAHAAGAAGTTVRNNPSGMVPPCSLWNNSHDAARGQVPRPLIVITSRRSAR